MRALQLLRYVGIVALITCVVVGVAVGVHQVRPTGYAAEAVLVVPSNAAAVGRHSRSYQGPGLEDQAQKLAVTFAGLIPNDQAILKVASRQLRRSTTDIQSRLTVVNDANTSLVRIRYTGQHAAEGLLGASVIAKAVSAARPVSTAIPAGALMLVRLPDKTTTAYSIGTLLGVAAVLGIALGVLLVVVLKRVNPRLNRPRDLETLLGVPVSATRWLTTEEIEGLLRDWREHAKRAGRISDDRIAIAALVPTSKRAASATRELAARLTSAHLTTANDAFHTEEIQEDLVEATERRFGSEGGGLTVPVGAGSPRSPAYHRLAFVEVIPRAKAGRDLDRGAIASRDVIVLVVSPGTTSRRVTAIVDVLGEMARAPDAAIFADGVARNAPS